MFLFQLQSRFDFPTEGELLNLPDIHAPLLQYSQRHSQKDASQVQIQKLPTTKGTAQSRILGCEEIMPETTPQHALKLPGVIALISQTTDVCNSVILEVHGAN